LKINKKGMTNTALKNQLYKTIEAIDDSTLLKAVYTILKSNISPQNNIETMSELEFYDRNTKSQKDVKKGNLISQTEMKKKFTKKELIYFA
jgi:hypothetical protein